MSKAKELAGKQRDALLKTLSARFEAQIQRHPDMKWAAVEARLAAHGAKLWSLNEMEQSGGEPDVVAFDSATWEVVFVDCSAQRCAVL